MAYGLCGRVIKQEDFIPEFQQQPAITSHLAAPQEPLPLAFGEVGYSDNPGMLLFKGDTLAFQLDPSVTAWESIGHVGGGTAHTILHPLVVEVG